MTTVIHTPKNTIQRIETLWAYISEDATGEGVCAAPLMGPGSMVPLIAADEARLASLRPIAQALAKATGMKIKLVRFTAREELGTVGEEH